MLFNVQLVASPSTDKKFQQRKMDPKLKCCAFTFILTLLILFLILLLVERGHLSFLEEDEKRGCASAWKVTVATAVSAMILYVLLMVLMKYEKKKPPPLSAMPPSDLPPMSPDDLGPP